MPSAPSPIRFGLFEVDLHSGELRRAGLRIRLGDQPFQILAMLLEHPGRVVTRDELRQRLWSSDTFVDFEQGLNAAVKRLREALGDSAEHPRYIETIPRHGYRLITSPGVVDPQMPREPAPEPPQRPSAPRRLPWIAAILMVVAVLLAVRSWPWKESDKVRPVSLPIRSIAVLPLENLSSDPGQEHFSDGMTEFLITELAKAHSLRVISRRSVMRFKGTTKNIGEIGKELQVEALVEGAVLNEGNSVRVSIQLLRVNPEEHLWAQDYERDLSKALSPQRDLALEIATELLVQLKPYEIDPAPVLHNFLHRSGRLAARAAVDEGSPLAATLLSGHRLPPASAATLSAIPLISAATFSLKLSGCSTSAFAPIPSTMKSASPG